MTNGFDSGPWITGPPPPPPEPEEIPTMVMSEPPEEPEPSKPSGPNQAQRLAADWRERMRSLSTKARSTAPHVMTNSLYLVGAAAILVAYAFAWLYGLIAAVRHQPGLTAQDRALSIFDVGTIEWAAILLFGCGLVAVGRRLDMSVSGKPAELVLTGLLVAAGLTVAAAVFSLLVDLTNFGHGIDAAFLDIVARLAAIPMAAAAGWWAWQLREELKPLP